LLAELSRREKEANIRPDPDIDVYMKVTQRPLLVWDVFFPFSLHASLNLPFIYC